MGVINCERGGPLSFPERRKATRFRGKLPVELEQGTGLTRDFSALGVFFETDQSLTVGESIKFVIPLDYSDWGHPFRIRCQGEVLRVEPGGEKVGVAVAIHSYSFEEVQSPGIA